MPDFLPKINNETIAAGIAMLAVLALYEFVASPKINEIRAQRITGA